MTKARNGAGENENRALSPSYRSAIRENTERQRLSAMPTDIEVYCNCVERVRHDVSVAETVLTRKIDTGRHELNAELFFLHLRKALEEIAFASLSANRDKYSEARTGFATEWNARRMLGFLANVNPTFYPISLKAPQELAPGRKHFDRLEDGYLTKEDFVLLYDKCAEVLHSRNPYSPEDPAIDIHYKAEEWLLSV
jgi:hypothetical protein